MRRKVSSLEGQTLEGKIAEGPLKLDEALDILTRFVEQTDQLRILTLLPTAVKKIALFRSA